MNALPIIDHEGTAYFVDFRLLEIRPIVAPHLSTKFADIEQDDLFNLVDEMYWDWEFKQITP